METSPTHYKREQLLEFIERKLRTCRAVRAVVGVGSIASGRARAGSDIDAVVFMEPFDPYVVPAESIWRPADDTFHSIMADDETLDRDGIQLDFHRVDLGLWRDPEYGWPEESRAELASGWVAFDPTGEVTGLIAERTAYPEATRMRTLDEAIPFVMDHLDEDVVARAWETLGPVIASDRLQSVYEGLARALFAYNRRWRPWRSREMTDLVRLTWLPADFDEEIMAAAVAGGHDYASYLQRARALRGLAEQLLERLTADGAYGEDPVSEAFIRAHDEPGRAWNMAEWNAQHVARSPD